MESVLLYLWNRCGWLLQQSLWAKLHMWRPGWWIWMQMSIWIHWSELYRLFTLVYTISYKRPESFPLSTPDYQWLNSQFWTDKSCGSPAVRPRSPNTRIRGGNDAVPQSHPWQVALYESTELTDDYYLCGGILLDTETVLTAAHCIRYKIFQAFSRSNNIFPKTL